MALVATGHAQNVPPPPGWTPPGAAAPPGDGYGYGSAAASQAGDDPPLRAGRLAGISGSVSFHGAGAGQWAPAQVNFPLTSGDALWTQPQAGAGIEISDTRIVLDGGTEFDLDSLDAQTMAATVPQGETWIDIRAMAPGENDTLRTPRGSILLHQAVQVEIAAGDQQAPTRITVLAGTAQVQIPSTPQILEVAAGQTATIAGDQDFTTSIGPARHDAFLDAMLAAPTPPPPRLALPPEVQAMPGTADLAAYGAWQQSPQYGAIWYPQVAPGWVPYRDGHWAYVAPWGWTWVDAAPWGFAPFHYGRWVQFGDRWGWAPVYGPPGAVAPGFGEAGFIQPAYAPALVSFIGLAAGIGIGAELGGAFGHSVGWVPLGWNEPFHPWYHSSPGYIRIINRTAVSNVTNITRNTNITVNQFVNRGATTIVPRDAMMGSRPIGPAVQRVAPQQLAAFRPAATLPIRPNANALERPAAAGPPIRPPGTRAPVTLRPALAREPHPTPGPEPARPEVARPEMARPALPALGRPAAPAGLPHPVPPNPAIEHPAEQRPLEHRPMEQRPVEQRPVEQRAVEHRPVEQRPAQQRPTQQRPGQRPAAAQRPAPHPEARPAPRPQPRPPERTCRPEEHC